MNRTDRLYALTEELRRAGPRGRTGAALARHFEVAPRTIKRDITALQEAGVPIWATAGPGGGYALDPTTTLPPLTFSPREATAIAVSLALGPDLPFAPDGRAALTKVLGAMRPEDRESAAALGGRIWYRTDRTGPQHQADSSNRTDQTHRTDPAHRTDQTHRADSPDRTGSAHRTDPARRVDADRTDPAPRTDPARRVDGDAEHTDVGRRPARPAAARVVDEAIRDQVVVIIDYTDRDGRSTERRPVEPLTYALDRGRWFLLGWGRRRRAGRWFRLDRMDRAVLTTEHVAPRDLEEVFGPIPANVGPVVLD